MPCGRGPSRREVDAILRDGVLSAGLRDATTTSPATRSGFTHPAGPRTSDFTRIFHPQADWRLKASMVFHMYASASGASFSETVLVTERGPEPLTKLPRASDRERTGDMKERVASTLVLGAGVVGLSTALYLQRAGVPVTVIDPLPPAGGASFGNAGPDQRRHRGPDRPAGHAAQGAGLADRPLGPALSGARSTSRRRCPGCCAGSRRAGCRRVLAHLRRDARLAPDALRLLAGTAGTKSLYGDLIRPIGQVQVWEGEGETPGRGVERSLRERHGIRAEPLRPTTCAQMFPGISRESDARHADPWKRLHTSTRTARGRARRIARRCGRRDR